jgi:hypothetical protein
MVSSPSWEKFARAGSSARLRETMRSIEPAHNLSVVMAAAIPWCGLFFRSGSNTRGASWRTVNCDRRSSSSTRTVVLSRCRRTRRGCCFCAGVERVQTRQNCGTRERAALPRVADGAGARKPRCSDGATYRIERPPTACAGANASSARPHRPEWNANERGDWNGSAISNPAELSSNSVCVRVQTIFR